MADSQDAQATDRLVADFAARIEGLRRDGVPSYPPLGGRTPWAEATEAEKLEWIVWESTNVWLGEKSFAPGAAGPEVIAVPGAVALETVERHVDAAGLPASQREMLVELRAGLDAGTLGDARPDGKDLVAMGLARAVGIGDFDERLEARKEDGDRPWAEVPEARKVSLLVDMAQVTGPPGAYTLEAIFREVDRGKLPLWRREALDGLRDRFDHGELDGENPNPLYQGDRAELALRFAELGARIEDFKQLGVQDGRGGRLAWRGLAEGVKFDLILREIHELHLGCEASAFSVIDGEVDLTRVSGETRWEYEESRALAWPAVAGETDAFDRVAANLHEVWDTVWKQWFYEFPASPEESWEAQPAEKKIAFLADFAGQDDVSFERFAAAARQMLGMEPGQEFPADIEPHLHRELDQARESYARTRSDQQRSAETGDFDRVATGLSKSLADRVTSPADLVERQDTSGQRQGQQQTQSRGISM